MKKKIVYITIYTIFIISIGVLGWQLHSSKYPNYINEINVEKLWHQSGGENVLIAFIDSGMHQKLAEIYGERVVKPFDFVENSEVIIDTNGHGTALICIAT